MKFNVFKSNLASVSADAIVIPANERLREMPGLSESVFEAAGRKHLQKTCDEIGYCAVGSAVPTLAYGLNADYIVHAVLPKWVDGSHGEYEQLASAYLSALNIADLMGCESVAFPLLTRDMPEFDEELSLSIAKNAMERFYGKNLKKIALILVSSQTENMLKTSVLTLLTYTKENQKTELLIDQSKSVNLMIENKKRLAKQIAKEQLQKVSAWLQVKENKNKLFACGILVVAALLGNNEKAANRR